MLRENLVALGTKVKAQARSADLPRPSRLPLWGKDRDPVQIPDI